MLNKKQPEISVIIPARNEPFLQKTIDDIFEKASGKIEVIAMLDGYWPDPPLKYYDNLKIIHSGTPRGMRENINIGANISTGDFLMKCDAHCMFGEKFDEILQADCEENWLAVPRRYSLDPYKWERTDKHHIDYLTLTFPYNTDDTYGTGLHGKKWPSGWKKEEENKHILIDDIISFQGSCWFMHKKKFFEIGGMDALHYNFHQEAQELGMKIWLSGGRVIRNKKTWYAHLHKGKTHGRGYYLSKQSMIESELYSTNLWMNNLWPGQTRTLKWLIDKFWPLEGWPDDWQDVKYQQQYKHHGLNIAEKLEGKQ